MKYKLKKELNTRYLTVAHSALLDRFLDGLNEGDVVDICDCRFSWEAVSVLNKYYRTILFEDTSNSHVNQILRDNASINYVVSRNKGTMLMNKEPLASDIELKSLPNYIESLVTSNVYTVARAGGGHNNNLPFYLGIICQLTRAEISVDFGSSLEAMCKIINKEWKKQRVKNKTYDSYSIWIFKTILKIDRCTQEYYDNLDKDSILGKSSTEDVIGKFYIPYVGYKTEEELTSLYTVFPGIIGETSLNNLDTKEEWVEVSEILHTIMTYYTQSYNMISRANTTIVKKTRSILDFVQ